MPVWLLAFGVSVLLTVVLTPLSRRLALSTDLVDKPGHHKSHIRPTPYLGGVGIIASVLVALALDGRANPRVAAIAAGAAVIGTLGLVDDDRTVDPRLRFITEVGVAAVLITFGLRIHATGIFLVDAALTLVWVVGLTNALNLLDNMDGLAAGVAAAASAAIFALAILALQPVVATAAASVVGACLAFLWYNRPPASIFMGDAGSLFLGFMLAVLTVSVSPALDPPFSFGVPLLLLALPILDTSTVTLARLRRGLRVSEGGRDHLSHRLVALGLSRGKAVATLIAVEVALGVLAVLGGRRVLQMRWTMLGAILVVGVVAGVTSRARVYVQPVVGIPKRLRLGACALAGGAACLAAPATVVLLSSAADMGTAVRRTEVAFDSLPAADAARAADEFERAARSFGDVERRLRGPWVSLGLAVPGLASNLQASRTLASVGERVSSAGAMTAGNSGGDTVPVAAGSVSFPELSRLSGRLSEAADVFEVSHVRLAEVERPFLVPSLRRAVQESEYRLVRADASARRLATSARIVPLILGSADTRHYFVAFQNSDEARATGGVIEAWAELVAEGGRLRVERSGRRHDLEEKAAASGASGWKDANVSPDFPTTARRIGELYAASGGRPISGVIALDPVGLASLLELVGPVPVNGLSEPVGPGNVIEILRRAQSPDNDRERDVVGPVVTAALDAFTKTDLGTAGNVVRTLGRAAEQQHLLIYLARPEEEQALAGLAVDGRLPPVRGDSILVVNQSTRSDPPKGNFGRALQYDVLLEPGRSTAEVSGRLGIRPGASSTGEPALLPEHVSVYSPFDAATATLGGRSVGIQSQPVLGRQAHSLLLDSPQREDQTLLVEMRGRLPLAPDGWYRLDVVRQPSVAQDLDVSIAVPGGWRIAETQGVDRVDDRHARASSRAADSGPILVRLERTGIASIWHRLTRT